MKPVLLWLMTLTTFALAEPQEPTLAPEAGQPPVRLTVFQAAKKLQEGLDPRVFSADSAFTKMNAAIEKCVSQDEARYGKEPFQKTREENPDKVSANHRTFTRCVRAATLEFTRAFGAVANPGKPPKICAD